MKRATVLLAALLLLTGCAGDPTPVATALDADARLQKQIDDLWDAFSRANPTVERPDVPVERIIRQSEWAEVVGDCVQGEGFPDVEIGDDGSIGFSTEGDAQRAPYDLAMYVCQARFPLDPRYSAPLDDDALGRLYDFYVDEQVPCLEGQGFDIPEPPSRQQFIDSYFDYPTWIPYAFVMSPEALQSGFDPSAIDNICPQDLPDSFFGIE